MQEGRVSHYLTTHGEAVIGFLAIIDGSLVQLPFAYHLHQVGAVGIDDDLTVGSLEEIVQLALGALHPLERAEAQQVCPTYIGDQSDVGFANIHQLVDVARMTGSHLDNGYLMFGFQAQHRSRYTDTIVEVALCIEHIVFLGKNGSGELLGGSFAIGARNADDGDARIKCRSGDGSP